MAKNLKWYFMRLKAMSITKVLLRSRSLITKYYLKSRSSWISPVPKTQAAFNDWWHLPNSPLKNSSGSQALIDEAWNYLKGDYTFLNISCQESPLNWHLDPQTNKLAPLKFGLDLNYRDFSLVGNVKSIWEKNRHHHLTVLT